MVYREGLRPTRLCPRCHRALDRVECAGVESEPCPECHGSFVTDGVFARMWDRLAPLSQPPPFSPRVRGAPAAPCPECRQPMERVALVGVPLDRCLAHGIWFDRIELETVLAASMLSRSEWLAMFLHRLEGMS